MLIRPISSDPVEQSVVARWSVDEWTGDFPDDTEGTYLSLYAEAMRDPDVLPVVLVAVDEGELLGTAALVADDELPDATEPGPWLAAAYVTPDARQMGVGTRLVTAIEEEARRLGFIELFLYTHARHEWYQRRGWRVVRHSGLRTGPVTVMRRDLRD